MLIAPKIAIHQAAGRKGTPGADNTSFDVEIEAKFDVNMPPGSKDSDTVKNVQGSKGEIRT